MEAARPATVDDLEAIESILAGLVPALMDQRGGPVLLAGEVGGLSGAPLKTLAQIQLRAFRAVAGDTVPLIGVGGIATAEDAWARIRAGASAVQLYSAMVYHGPGIARQITRGLERLLRRDGFGSIAEAVGSA